MDRWRKSAKNVVKIVHKGCKIITGKEIGTISYTNIDLMRYK